MQHKSGELRKSVMLCIDSFLGKQEYKIFSLKENDKLILVIGNYLLDSSQSVRTAAKLSMAEIIKNNMNFNEIDLIFKRTFSDSSYTKIRKIIDKELINSD